ncbi:pentapeptide repeat-containing protein [Roseovarius mucosus]|nr:pentapeptide repeat-containing protein [Roseovarius mucosus]
MDQTDLTITLPLSAQQGQIILFALGIAVASVIVWVATETETRKPSPLALLKAFGWAMVPIWLLLFGGTLWQVWQMLSGGDTAFAGRQSLGAGALVAALLGAPFVVWGTVLKQRTVDFQQEGHITDRINKAVEQLGAEKSVKRDGKETTEPNIEVRIGAILSLERIAQDSTRYDKGRDHVRVMEILCAYVRENSNARAPRDFPLVDWEPLKDDATKAERKAHEMWREVRFRDRFNANAREWAVSLPKPRADIAQTLQVLGRRTAEQRRVEAAWPNPPEKETVWPFDVPCPELSEVEGDDVRTSAEIESFKKKLVAWRDRLHDYSGYRLDLRGANLQGTDLSAKRPDASDAVFAGLLLVGTRIEGANLSEARMEGADLNAARMEGANLSRARMEGADLSAARIEGANLFRTRMGNANLFWAQMEGASLFWARMEGASLSGARMEGAYLSGARMEGAYLSGARMEGTFLTEARMEGASLFRARMDSFTSLMAATFQGAAMRDMNLRKVPIFAEQLNSSFGDLTVELPKGMARPAHWPDWELDGQTFDTEWRKWRNNPIVYTPPPKPEG